MNITSTAGSANVTITLTKKELGELLALAEPSYETLRELHHEKGPCRSIAKGKEECTPCRRMRTTLETFAKFSALALSTTDELLAQLASPERA